MKKATPNQYILIFSFFLFALYSFFFGCFLLSNSYIVQYHTSLFFCSLVLHYPISQTRYIVMDLWLPLYRVFLEE